MLDLVKTKESNMKNTEEGRLSKHIDCRKVWELSTVDDLKSTHYAGDGDTIISKILILEKEVESRI